MFAVLLLASARDISGKIKVVNASRSRVLREFIVSFCCYRSLLKRAICTPIDVDYIKISCKMTTLS